MKTFHIYNNGHSSKINCNENGRTQCRSLDIEDLKNWLNKKISIIELGNKYFKN